MKKIALLSLSILLIISLLSGCVRVDKGISPKSPGQDNDDASPNPQGITYNKQNYTKVEYDKLPQQLKNIIDEHRETGEVLIVDGPDDTQYVYIALGMRGSAGYDVEILYCEDVEGGISVVYKEIKPAPEQPVADVITYPWIVIQIESTLPINVTEQKQEDNNPPTNPSNPPIVDKGTTNNPISFGDYSVIDPSQLKEDMIRVIDRSKYQRGYLIIKESFLMISAGQKPTGGYGIEISDVQRKGDKTTIRIKETKPPRDSMVIQVITFPYLVLNINTDLNIEVIDEGGNTLPQIKNTDM
jgi:hypothetical protein